jgi:dephospho-CoA kinase
MLRLGITGGYGSGKSTAAQYFERKGYPIVYADPLAKKLMTEDAGVRKKIIDLLGNDAYNPDGTLNTQHVADIIFTEPGKKRAVERFVHPAVLASIDTFFTEKGSDKSYSLTFVEAALIFESRMEDMLDYVIAVIAPEEQRIRRIMQRDGTHEEEIRKRIAAQHSDEYFKARADFIIENTGDIRHLHQRCAFLETLFLSMETSS